MRLLLVALLVLPFAPAGSEGAASVDLDGEGAPASFAGTAYFLVPDGADMGVVALATAPLEGGTWAHGGAPFSYVEVVLFRAPGAGAFAVGPDARVTVYHWADHDAGPAFFAMADGGTLTLTSVSDASAAGTLTATLTTYDEAGEAQPVRLDASFTAVPGDIPSP